MARMILRILGKRGRATVPFSLRKELGLQPGDIVSFTLENDSMKFRREKLCDFENCPAMMDSGKTLPTLCTREQWGLSPPATVEVPAPNMWNRISWCLKHPCSFAA